METSESSEHLTKEVHPFQPPAVSGDRRCRGGLVSQRAHRRWPHKANKPEVFNV